jgi:hypothetical protein
MLTQHVASLAPPRRRACALRVRAATEGAAEEANAAQRREGVRTLVVSCEYARADARRPPAAGPQTLPP